MDFNIGELHPNTPYLFADLAELALLVGYNGRAKFHKNDLEGVIDTGIISPEEIDLEADAEIEANVANETGAEKNTRREKQLEDVITQLGYRSKAMGDYYPFTVTGESLILNRSLTSRQRVYRMLLACSRLRSFKGEGVAQRWAKAFTKICKIAMMGLVPSHATVRIFDANSDDRNEFYTHDLRAALKTLGTELAVKKVDHDECDRAGISGDAGLDLVAIINFEDVATCSYALLGQCGAQETGWPKKTLEAHSMRYKGYYHMVFDYPSVMFTPVCYRTADGEWYDIQAATGILLLDRIRILKLLDTQDCWDEIVGTQWFINFEAEINTTAAAD